MLRSERIHKDLVVFTSSVWQTNCTAFRSDSSTLLIDSPVFPQELDELPGLLREAGFPMDDIQLFGTHGDWDHVLGPVMFPDAPLWCGETTPKRLETDPGEFDRMMQVFDLMFYVERTKPLRLNNMKGLPVPGSTELGHQRLRLIEADGHTDDGTAVILGDTQVLAVGDYISPVEIPRLRGSLDRYLDTLERVEAEVQDLETVVPGHGPPMEREMALRVLREDRAYLMDLQARGLEAQLPPGRDDAEQMRVHRELNVQTASGHKPAGLYDPDRSP